ncbi:MAG: DUF364 domain-containing protein [Clostridiales bacterium]|nr:DUF364 domain-containing protein [Clostridiales bacterium]
MTSNLFLEKTVERTRALAGSELDEITVERAVFGLFYSGVKISTGQGGLCFTPVKGMPEAVCCPSSAKAMPLSGKLAGRKVAKYLADIFDGNILRRTLGIAALNALSTLCWERGAYITADGTAYALRKSKDAFEELEIAQDERVAVVGAMVPILKKLAREGHDYTVLEMDSRTLKGDELAHYRPANEAGQVIPHADLLVLTGVTILNDTLAGLLDMAKPGARVLVIGPTASMLPDAFFAHGVTMMGGVIVTDTDVALDIISEAGSGYHFYGKSAERLLIEKL